MIKFIQGDLFDSNAEALVNAVNTVGVMGKGIALTFKMRYPYNNEKYIAACKTGELDIGKVFSTLISEGGQEKWVVNFPTKKHWRNASELDWITLGLKSLKKFILDKNINSIAIPPLGAGNGGLDWKEVKKEIENELAGLENVSILVYEPSERFAEIKKNKIKKTISGEVCDYQLLLSEVIKEYIVITPFCSLIELNKLAWFVNRIIVQAGFESDFKIKFSNKNFGPYSTRVKTEITKMESYGIYFSKDISSIKPSAIIPFKNNMVFNKAGGIMYKNKSFTIVPDRVMQLINGYESPSGLELLSTVDWTIFNDGIEPNAELVKDFIFNSISTENEMIRKAKIFSLTSIDCAISRLCEFIKY